MAEQSRDWGKWYPLPAPHDAVAIQVFMYRESNDTFDISYHGKPSELIASGAVPSVALQPYDRSKAREDEEGDAVRIYHGSLKRGGRIMVMRSKSPAGAAKLLGVTATMLRKAREYAEGHDSAANERRERDEAHYRAEELAIKCLRRIPAGRIPNADEALRFLADLRKVLDLANTRRGAREYLVSSLADQVSLPQIVRLLEKLPM